MLKRRVPWPSMPASRCGCAGRRIRAIVGANGPRQTVPASIASHHNTYATAILTRRPPLDEKGRMTVKKYSNRRLYDTSDSRYITLEDLAEKARQGEDVRVVDAKTGEDLTAATFTQAIVEGRGPARWLPDPLLLHPFRLGDHSLP